MRHTGAGVIIYATNEGNLTLLLGKEKETFGWKQGSCRWSAFSGKLEKNEEPIHAAAREFIEETCCTVPIEETYLKSTEDAIQSLHDNSTHIQLKTILRNEELIYHLFLVKVKFQPFDTMFAKTRSMLSTLDVMCRQFYKLKNYSDIVSLAFFPGFYFSSCLVVVDISIKLDLAYVTLYDLAAKNRRVFKVSYVVDSQHMKKVKQIHVIWLNIQNHIQKMKQEGFLQHPAITLTKVGSFIINVQVNENYLEKCEIGWWNLDELMRVHLNFLRYQIDDERFRTMFIANLQQIHDQIKFREASK